MKLKARPATIKDKAQLLLWANDQETRRQSFITKRITKKEHHQWFSKVLTDKHNQRLFILENDDKSPCGQVRFSRNDENDWGIHFSLDAQYRGQNLGRQMIRICLDIFKKNDQRLKLIAKVKKDNLASLKVLAAAGVEIEKNSSPDANNLKLIYITK